jgi:hypothetical protein
MFSAHARLARVRSNATLAGRALANYCDAVPSRDTACAVAPRATHASSELPYRNVLNRCRASRNPFASAYAQMPLVYGHG